MLPATFNEDSRFRLSTTVLGILAVAILTAGLCLTGLLAFAVRNPLFLADNVLLPSLTSSSIGLLTVPYNFLVNSRYVWNTPALLIVIAASLCVIAYGSLLLWTYRRIRAAEQPPSTQAMPLQPNATSPGESTPWQEPAYYENYIRNMFPASAHHPSAQNHHYDANSITEEEMQRQQMLMLLLQQTQSPPPNSAQGTFKIDWQSQEQDDVPPTHSYFAPSSAASSAAPAHPISGIARQFTDQELRPWDGVWRDPTPVAVPARPRASSREDRERRRLEIESGQS